MLNRCYTYIRRQIFDKIPELVYTIECESYFAKDGTHLDDEATIEHLTIGEQVEIKAKLDNCDENDEL